MPLACCVILHSNRAVSNVNQLLVLADEILKYSWQLWQYMYSNTTRWDVWCDFLQEFV